MDNFICKEAKNEVCSYLEKFHKENVRLKAKNKKLNELLDKILTSDVFYQQAKEHHADKKLSNSFLLF